MLTVDVNQLYGHRWKRNTTDKTREDTSKDVNNTGSRRRGKERWFGTERRGR